MAGWLASGVRIKVRVRLAPRSRHVNPLTSGKLGAFSAVIEACIEMACMSSFYHEGDLQALNLRLSSSGSGSLHVSNNASSSVLALAVLALAQSTVAKQMRDLVAQNLVVLRDTMPPQLRQLPDQTSTWGIILVRVACTDNTQSFHNGDVRRMLVGIQRMHAFSGQGGTQQRGQIVDQGAVSTVVEFSHIVRDDKLNASNRSRLSLPAPRVCGKDSWVMGVIKRMMHCHE